MTEVHGVSLGRKVTPLMVRDALVECFYQAHRFDSGIKEDEQRDYCKEIVKKAFLDTGENFEKPNKKSLLAVMDNLAKFAKNFRDARIVEKHYQEIMQLVNNLKE